MALRELTVEELDKARTQRQQAILSRWMAGARLSRAELDEIRDVIGEERFKESGGVQGPDALSGQAQYLHDLKDYAATYRRSVRQIKRWIKAGRYAKPPVMPPLDAPGEMLAWWNRMLAIGQLKQKPPVVLEQFAIAQSKGDAPTGGLSAIDISLLNVEEGMAIRQ